MRLFGSERIAKVMDRIGIEEGEVIQHSMISKSIERAQKKVEENNFGIRKRLLEYDDVMNQQRTVIYNKRRHALMGERIGVDIANMFYDTTGTLAENCANDYESLKMETLSLLGSDVTFSEEEFKKMKMANVADVLYDNSLAIFKRRMEKIAEVANPIIKQVYEEQGQKFENIIVPLTDGKRNINVRVNLKEAYESESKEVYKAFQKMVLLFVIDEAWKEHLRELDELRNSVQNATYEQKDPLLIYKLESFNLFKSMIDSLNKKGIGILMRGQIPVRQANDVQQARELKRQDYSKYRTQKDDLSAHSSAHAQAQNHDTREQQKTQPIRAEKRIGRNEPCPCGSGKKYKSCCGKNIQ